MRAPIRSRRTVVGLSAMIWDILCSPFSFDGSMVTRKSGASASDDVIWQMTTDACVAGNESLWTTTAGLGLP